MAMHGTPCWYELGTTDLDAATHFYGAVLGWSVADSGMPGMDYRLATARESVGVAGMTAVPAPGTPPNWLVYLAVDNADATAAATREAGGSVLMEPADIPGTGRFAVLTDPQGAAFGVLEPLPMDAPPTASAFDQSRHGHGNWHELMTADVPAALEFYSGLFGWTKSLTMEMGEMGVYQLFAHDGVDIGGIQGLGASPMPFWLPYFGTQDGIGVTHDRIREAGGTVHHGPADVPGGAQIVIATDPQGAWFAVVGSPHPG